MLSGNVIMATCDWLKINDKECNISSPPKHSIHVYHDSVAADTWAYVPMIGGGGKKLVGGFKTDWDK